MPSRHDPVRMPAEQQRVGVPCRGRGGDSGGFVLVAVLLLIALATVLIVTTSSVSQIERKAVANSAKEDLARQNALFALQVALAQLQSAAGPDQRVTATADILSGVGTAVTQPYWTGVWKTGTNGLDIANSGTPQRQASLGALDPTADQKAASAIAWLVSGATNHNTISPNASTVSPRTWSDTSGGQTNSVALARNYGTNLATVRVPLVVVTNTFATGGVTRTNVGAYAYWVSDEGVKAKVNMNDPTLKTFGAGVSATGDLAKNLLHFVAPQAAVAYKGSAEFGTTDLRADTNNVPKITTLQSLANLVPGLAGTNAAKIAADFTTYSMGVIADVRQGGLKRDLTAALEDNGANPSVNYGKLNPNGTNRVYTAPENTIGTISSTSYTLANGNRGLDGLRWINLYYHYNLYKSAEPSVNMYGRTVNGTSPSGVGNPTANNRPYTVTPRALGWIDNSLPSTPNDLRPFINYGALSPVFLGLRWDVTLNSTEVTAGQYNLYLNYYPQFVLYNPYSVRISSPSNNFRFARALASLGSLYLQISLPVTSASGPAPITTTNNYHVALNLGSTLQRLIYNTSFVDTQTFEPGEIRVYGLSNTIVSDLKAPNPNFAAACEFKFTNSPYGLVSRGYAVSFKKYAPIQAISALSSNALADTYANISNIPTGTPITLRLTARPGSVGTNANTTTLINLSGSAFSDVSISSGAFWPTIGGQSAGSIVDAVTVPVTIAGSDTRRIFVAGAPGANSTGSSTPSGTRSDLTTKVEDLTGETLVFSFFTRKKGINRTGGPAFSNANISVPWFSGNSILFNLSDDSFGARWWDELCLKDLYTWQSYPPSSAETISTTTTSAGYTTTSWGNASTGAAIPTPNRGSRIVLFDVPVQPMVSLGQFMHIKPSYAFTTGDYTSMGFGNMFIGGSLPSPEIPLEQTVIDNAVPNYRTLIIDHSFLANQALFDSYFFSTVPPKTLASGTTFPASWTAFNSANTGTTLSDPSIPLLNSRMKPYYREGTNPPIMDNLRDMDKAAANLMLDGAFNVNSTSVAAWKAFLSSTSGNDLDIWDASTGSAKNFSASELATPFVRFYGANGNGNVNDLWSGIRSLSDIDIDNLATRIVAEVRARGPFLSMADFLNRRLGASSTDLTRAGALQAAIDKTSLNKSMKDSGVDISIPISGPNLCQIPPIPNNMRDASSTVGAVWRTTIGAPGYFMQQDLVQALSPGMTVRSDTFLIRTYGEVRNPRTGIVESSAWGEAVVQRVPDLFDISQQPETAQSAMNATNLTFGRRFKIVSFRWLNSNEI